MMIQTGPQSNQKPTTIPGRCRVRVIHLSDHVEARSPREMGVGHHYPAPTRRIDARDRAADNRSMLVRGRQMVPPEKTVPKTLHGM